MENQKNFKLKVTKSEVANMVYSCHYCRCQNQTAIFRDPRKDMSIVCCLMPRKNSNWACKITINLLKSKFGFSDRKLKKDWIEEMEKY